jgi:hypothetical protein
MPEKATVRIYQITASTRKNQTPFDAQCFDVTYKMVEEYEQ